MASRGQGNDLILALATKDVSPVSRTVNLYGKLCAEKVRNKCQAPIWQP